MCFSAAASFTGAAVLAIIGALTVKQVKEKRELFLACIPWIFAIQQFSEGLLWLSSTDPSYSDHYRLIFEVLYLFIAAIVWPIWLPLSLFIIEPDRIKKRRLGVLLAGGILFDLLILLGFFLATSIDQLQITTSPHQLIYKIPIDFGLTYVLFYCLVTILPFFVSSYKNIRWLGVLNLIALIISLLFFYEAMVSVWCFFAAWISLGICAIFYKKDSPPL